MGVARLGNRPPVAMGAAGMLTGHQTDKGHQLPRRIKAREVPQFGQGRNAGEHVQAARLRLQRPTRQRLLQLFLQPLDPGLGLLHRVHVFLKHDLLGRMLEPLTAALEDGSPAVFLLALRDVAALGRAPTPRLLSAHRVQSGQGQHPAGRS